MVAHLYTSKHAQIQHLQAFYSLTSKLFEVNKIHKSSFITGFLVGLLTYWTFSSGLVKINLDANALPFADDPNATKTARGG
jgi:hypothetical protein